MLEIAIQSLRNIDVQSVESVVYHLAALRQRSGRLFCIGNGGGMSHASHAASDFRTLCGIDAHSVGDNQAYITAAANDHGWDNAYTLWLDSFTLGSKDAVLVFSVGGGSKEPPVSLNIVKALSFADRQDATILAIVGRNGGFAATVAETTILIPVSDPEFVTPATEGIQSVVAHWLVSKLSTKKAKWESLA